MRPIKKFIIAATTVLLFLPGAVFAQSISPSPTDSGPTLKVLTPQDGQTIYGDKIPVLVSVENFKLVDYQTNTSPVPGEGHIHLWLDDANPTKESATKITEDNFTYSDVAFGDHTLRAELVASDHSSLVPPVVTTVKFKSQAATSNPPAASTGFDKSTAVVILVVVALVIVAAWWYTKDEDEETEMATEPKKAPARKTTKKKSTAKRRKR